MTAGPVVGGGDGGREGGVGHRGAVRAGRRDGWARWATAAELAAVIAFTLWIAWPFIAPGGYVTDYDTLRYSGPNLAATFRAWDEHRLPFWEPGIFGGTAFAGNLQTAVFSPLKVLVWPLGAPTALGALTALHLLVLAVGMWFLARRSLRLPPPAGLVAALVLVGSGTTMVQSVRSEQIAVVAWIPWLLAALDAIVAAPAGRRARPVAAGAAVTALVLVSGHPHQALIGGALAAVWVVARVLDRRAPDLCPPRRAARGGGYGRVLAAAGLGVGIAALPLVLAVPLLRGMAVPAGTMLDEAALDRYILAPSRLLPALLGDGVPAPLSGFPTVETPAFVGAAALVLAAIGGAVWCFGATGDRGAGAIGRCSTGRALVLVAAVGVLLAFGPAFGVYRAAALVPGLGNGRVPVRWLFVTTLAIALLAAGGTSWLMTRGFRPGSEGRTPRRAAALVAAVIVLAAVAPPWGAGPPLGARVGWLAVLAVAGAAFAGLGRWAPGGRRRCARSRARSVAVVLVAVAAVELGGAALVGYGRSLHTARSFADRATAVDEFLSGQGARALEVRPRPDPNANLTAGWRSLDGYDGGLWLTDRYVSTGHGLSGGDFWPVERLGEQVPRPVDGEALARLGVRYVVTADGAALPGWWGPVAADGARAVWENPWFRGEARWVSGPESAQPPDAPAPALTRPAPGQIDVATPPAAGGGRLAVAEQALPGWAVSVDDREAALVEGDGFGLGVDVPPGAHEIRFRYSPPGLWAGAAVSLLALALAALAALVPQRPRRRSAPSSSGVTGRSGRITT